MKRTVKVKNIIAFAAVLILLFSITAIPAYAEFPPLTTAGRRLGSWILSGITALNIALSSTVSTSQGADIINFLGDPLDLTYSYTELWEDKPTIQIWDDYVTIDGVTYTDIWLSNEAAQKFKTDGLDFATAYSIASNTNGTFASGVGNIDGSPAFLVDGVTRTQTYTFQNNGVYSMGDTRIYNGANYTNILYPGYNLGLAYQYGDGTKSGGSADGTYIASAYKQRVNANPPTWRLYYKLNTATPVQSGPVSSNGYVNAPFDFNWVSHTIDPTPLQPDEGLIIRVPSDTPGLQNYITNNYYLTEPTEIDVDLDPDILGKLDDLIDIIAPILINLDSHDVQYTTNHEAPAPVPDVPIVDATVDQVTQPIINEITNYGDQITQQIPNIIETIPTIDSICENIDTAPYHDLDTGLDRLPTFFLPFITDLRSALGIWHYVTEWLAQISSTFAFISGCLVGTSIMTPIYAAIAGFMCIKIYRRMTA